MSKNDKTLSEVIETLVRPFSDAAAALNGSDVLERLVKPLRDVKLPDSKDWEHRVKDPQPCELAPVVPVQISYRNLAKQVRKQRFVGLVQARAQEYDLEQSTKTPPGKAYAPQAVRIMQMAMNYELPNEGDLMALSEHFVRYNTKGESVLD